MRQLRIDGSKPRRPLGLARTHPTIDIGSNLRANPIGVGIVGTFVNIKPQIAALGKPLMTIHQQLSIRSPLGGVSARQRKMFQPGPSNRRRRQVLAMGFEQHQGKHRIIDVIIRHAHIELILATSLQ